MNARFFGETPIHTFQNLTSNVVVGGKGTATIQCVTDVVFNNLVFRNTITSIGGIASVPLNGTTFVAGSIIYGVAQYAITSGSGIAYHSMGPVTVP